MPIQPLPTSDGRGEWAPHTLGESLDRLLGQMGAPRRSTVAGLHERWAEVVGDALAAHTRPVRVRDGALVVGVDDPAWATQVRWLGTELAARARLVLNDDSIERIEVRIGSEGTRDPRG